MGSAVEDTTVRVVIKEEEGAGETVESPRKDWAWLAFALTTLCCYGVNNFLLSAIAELADDPSNANVSGIFVVWAAAGVCGIVALAYQAMFRGGALACINGARNGVIASSSGFLSGCGTFALSIALATDPDSAGPITAVLPLNSLLVAALAFVVIGERLTKLHVLGVCIAVCGPVMMAVADTSSSALSGLGYGGLTACCFGMSNFLRKFTRAYKAGDFSVVVLIFLTLGVMSCIGIGVSFAVWGKMRGLDTFRLFAYAAASGLLWVAGSVFFQLALAGLAGPASAIANVNSVVVLVLNIIFFSPSLSALKIAGMGVCLLGITVLSLAPKPSQPTPPEEQEDDDPPEDPKAPLIN